MTVRSSIDKQRRLVLTKVEGSVTFDDVMGHRDRLLADPQFDASFDELIDATGVTKLDISADEVRTFAHRRVLSVKSRRAVVATRAHIFGVGRMMEIYHEDVVHTETEVFYSMDEALQWLRREEEKHQNHEAGPTDPEEKSVSKRQ
jgi:hypothetical protein